MSVGFTFSDLDSGRIEAVAFDRKSGNQLQLATRARSRCLFFDEFESGNFRIQLRLDWGSLDSSGNPTLDADFKNIAIDKVAMSKTVRKIHHTIPVISGERSYQWSFSDKDLDIVVTITWKAFINEQAMATDQITATVIRGLQKE